MRKYDWEAIERDYRAGLLSIRQLASKHEVPESTVRSKARVLGWQRDLTEEVRAATRIKLSRSSRSGIAHDDDARIIEEASTDAASIVASHRYDIAYWRKISDRLAHQLETMEITDTNFEKFGRTLNAGIDAVAKVIKLERQAYNLDDGKPEEPMDAITNMTDDELNARIDELTRELGYVKLSA